MSRLKSGLAVAVSTFVAGASFDSYVRDGVDVGSRRLHSNSSSVVSTANRRVADADASRACQTLRLLADARRTI